ncbi:MAG: ATP-binding protein [Rhodobacter sp.]|nr:ATP-binding protein [Rhodobacter sp.]
MTISRIHLTGFKRFADFSVNCKENNILVGPNNAGKSTTLDALRLANDAIRFANRRRPELASQGDDGVCATYRLSINRLSVPIDSINRNYQDDDARVVVRHENGNELVLVVGAGSGAVAYLKTENALPRSPAAFRALFPIDLVIVPTLGPFEAEERYLTDETVRANENTRLAHRNFRNIMLRKSATDFNELAELLQSTWPEMTIERPRVIHGQSPWVSMMYQERRIPRELHWSGFGFQVWLQMLVQIMRGSGNSVLVLDEPDIYLHADLQKRLVQIVKSRFQQLFLATHSTEIINEAEPGDILSINSEWRNARRVNSDEAYRQLFKYIGSSENAEFARVARAKRIVFFEGKDKRMVRWLSDKLETMGALSSTDTVVLQAGGFGQWKRIVNTNWTLETLFGMDVKIIALFDRDYRTEEEVREFEENTSSEMVLCRVLNRKEIENYCLEVEGLIKAMTKRVRERGQNLSDEQAEEILRNLSDQYRVDVQSNLTGSAIAYYRKAKPDIDASSVAKTTLGDFDSDWDDLSKRLKIIPGKDFIAVLSAKLQGEYGCSITFNQILAEVQRNQIDAELVKIFEEFEGFLAS